MISRGHFIRKDMRAGSFSQQKDPVWTIQRSRTSLAVSTEFSASDQTPTAGSYVKNRLHAFDRNEQPADFFEYTIQLIRGLLRADWSLDFDIAPATPLALDRTQSILRKIGRPSSVYPAIAPDGEGGLEIRWRAELHSLRIEVDESGEVSALATGPQGTPTFDLPNVKDFDIPMLAAALWNLSEYVESRNPDWRRWFRHP